MPGTNINKFTLLLFGLLAFAFIIPQRQTTYIGKVIFNKKNEQNIVGVLIEFKVGNVSVVTAKVKSDGTFKASVIADREMDIYYNDPEIGNTYIQTLQPTKKHTVALSFSIPRDNEKTNGKIICPKCNKYDQVLPIRNGLPIPVFEKHIDSNGDTCFAIRKEEENYGGGCWVSPISPEYYCKRDDIKF